MDDHPVRLAVTDDLRRSRLTAFFRPLLALPLLVWLSLWAVAVTLVALLAWVAALVRGRVPEGLHGFMAMYVRFAVHVGGFLSFAANPFPAFTGNSPYPVDVELPSPSPQRRATVAVRLLLALPALVVAAELGFGRTLAVCALLGWFAALALGRMTHGLRDLAAYALGYGAQASAYLLLLTDRYPNSDPAALAPGAAVPPHPVTLRLADDGRRSRVTALFRWLLALPHAVWLVLWTVAAILAALANGIVALVRGRSAEALHRFLAAYVRYVAHVTAFAALVANPFPGFAGTPGYPVEVALREPEPQNRWVTLLRTFLVVPALLVSAALGAVLTVVGVLGWVASVATGRMPTGLRNLGAVCVRYLSQTNAYWFVVTDAYPYAAPWLATAAPAEADS